MSDFVDLGNLIKGERYSFIAPQFPFSRSEGTFNMVTSLNNGVNKYTFSNVITYVPDPKPNDPNNMRKEIYKIYRFISPEEYPQNIIHLPLPSPTLSPTPFVQTQMWEPDDEDISPQPTSRGGKTRKSKRTRRSRKSKRTKRSRKSKRQK